ncbi:MAG: FtsL-like putative cell division protein [Ginsengibacter sp.]
MPKDEDMTGNGKKKVLGKKLRRSFIYNRWIVTNIPFYLFVAALAIIYIANGHYADKTIRKINSTASHLKEMEYEYKTIKRDVIFRSKESELVKAVEPLGLKELMIPPVRIIDTLNKQ